MRSECGKLVEYEELAVWSRCTDFFVLQDPGAVMGDEHGVEVCCQGRVDVGPRTVADHPCRLGQQIVAHSNGAVRIRIFFWNDLDSLEESCQARALHFARLFRYGALGHQDESMTQSEVLEGLGNVVHEFHGVLSDDVSEALDSLVHRGRDCFDGEALERVYEGMLEAV